MSFLQSIVIRHCITRFIIDLQHISRENFSEVT
jgi:hypothetical protein